MLEYLIDETSIRIWNEAITEVRLNFNKSCSQYEAWQIVCFTLSAILFIQWLTIILTSDFSGLGKQIMRNLPFLWEYYDKKREYTKERVQQVLLALDQKKEFYRFLPDRGISAEEIIREARDYLDMAQKKYTVDGKYINFIYGDHDEEQKELNKELLEMYFNSDALYPEMFPAIRKMEAEAVRIMCSMFHGGVKSCGAVTTSVSEAIFLACLSYKRRALEKNISEPAILLGIRAHAAFDKAAEILNMKVIRVPCDEFDSMDVGIMKRLISPEVCMIVVSAPNYVSGSMDQVEKIAKIVSRNSIPLHVDASFGGFILPFLEQCDYPPMNFDFALTAVTSISVDASRYGGALVGSSCILYRDKRYMEHQCFGKQDWSCGVYTAATMSENRGGFRIATIWSSLIYNGRYGYVEKAQKILDLTRFLRIELEKLDYIKIVGAPLLCVVSFTSDKVDLYKVADRMKNDGWYLDLIQKPKGIRFCISVNADQKAVVSQFVEELDKACQYIMDNTRPMVREDDSTREKTVFYGLSTPIDCCELSDELSQIYLDSYYATPNLNSHLIPQGKVTRTLSIDGRKMSSIITHIVRSSTQNLT
uniref:sphinganine-1-phosphate aldolase n=1 Tax=Parastrongyloides trichosuri TaxID=131310 RepID=A0A0N4ZBK4_PARTI